MRIHSFQNPHLELSKNLEVDQSLHLVHLLDLGQLGQIPHNVHHIVPLMHDHIDPITRRLEIGAHAVVNDLVDQVGVGLVADLEHIVLAHKAKPAISGLKVV